MSCPVIELTQQLFACPSRGVGITLLAIWWAIRFFKRLRRWFWPGAAVMKRAFAGTGVVARSRAVIRRASVVFRCRELRKIYRMWEARVDAIMPTFIETVRYWQKQSVR